MLYRYFISLNFDGTAYRGWQVQPGAPTIQGEIERAMGLLLGEPTRLTGAGRTDTGVHARAFFAHFDTNYPPEELPAMNLVYKLNRILPPDIAIQAIYPVHENAHARFDAMRRTYIYQICTRKDPFYHGMAWLMEREINLDAMQQAADLLPAFNDFSSFSKSNTQVRTNLCTITQARWERQEHMIRFTITADRFLRNMVRAIVGTLVEIGLEKIRPGDLPGIIEARDRKQAGYSAPGCGLFLSRIEYPASIFS
ncbi:MAG: tRNA pseudouridine(38-40) synthase TruA [Bacteroidales bacterium]